MTDDDPRTHQKHRAQRWRQKAFRTVLTANDYAAIKKYVDDYWSTNPRPVG